MLFHGEDLNISRRVKACFEKKKKKQKSEGVCVGDLEAGVLMTMT